MKIIFKAAYYAFVSALIFLAVMLVASLFPIPGNYKLKIVKSGSMEPSIMTGSMAFIKPSSQYNVGDIITFGKDDRKNIPTSHRIDSVRLEGGKKIFTTKGDANNSPDAKEISQNEIIGKVIFTLPYLGYVIDMAKKPLGFVFLIIIPSLVVAYDEIMNIWREAKKMKENRDKMSDSIKTDEK